MFGVPENPRATPEIVDTIFLANFQKYLFQKLLDGWEPTGDYKRWTHEDQQEAIQLGWMLVEAPDLGYSNDLLVIGLRKEIVGDRLLTAIKNGASFIPICQKALGILTAQKLTRGFDAKDP